MNKQEFIDQLAKKANLSKKDARTAVDAMLDLVVKSVKRGDKVQLPGFGAFEASNRKATRRMSPQTGRRVNVPAKRVPKFRPGKPFKEAVDRKK